jgi:hypothetical protein
MTDSSLFVIKTPGRPELIQLHAKSTYSLSVLMRGPGLRAEANVDHLAGNQLDRYFADLAAAWQGWSGAREWLSMAGEFRLSATMDRAGHVALVASLLQILGIWTATVTVSTESGQLDQLARNARAFVVAAGAAA